MTLAGPDHAAATADSTAVRLFVSYRRSDSPSAARQLAAALKARFGEDRVFFDTEDLRPGSSWHAEIVRRVEGADAVVAVVGPRWAGALDARGRSALVDPEEDVLRTEVEAALLRRRLLVPVLVDGARMPDPATLPRALQPLARLQAVELRHASWDADVAALLEHLEGQVAAHRASPSEPTVTAAPARDAAAPQVPGGPGAPGPEHYRDIARYLAEGSLVPVLGAGVNAADDCEPWRPGCGRLPTRAELARALGEHFGLGPGHADLARLAQHVFLTKGAADLDRALRELLFRAEAPPSPAHRFFARLPGLLRDAGRPSHQLLVTTTYDTALERAFREVHEPFDLAVFLAAGPHRGRFLHVRWEDGAAEPITVPNEYVGFPIDADYLDVTRTVILKIHGGGILDPPPGLRLKQNFVLTEDDYIAFLSESPVETLVPVQLLDKLRDSHFLFLGYGVAEWSLRVFLRRLWPSGRPAANSWAVADRLDEVDHEIWEKSDVGRLVVPLGAYLAALERFVRP